MYTTKQLAEYLGLAQITIRTYILNGKIKAGKVGRDWHINRSEARRMRQELRKGRERGDGRSLRATALQDPTRAMQLGVPKTAVSPETPDQN